MNAFLFVSTTHGKHWHVIEEATQIVGVKIAHAVTGQYDIIVYAEFATIPELRNIIDKFQLIKGVTHTTTAIAMPPRLHDSPE